MCIRVSWRRCCLADFGTVIHTIDGRTRWKRPPEPTLRLKERSETGPVGIRGVQVEHGFACFRGRADVVLKGDGRRGERSGGGDGGGEIGR